MRTSVSLFCILTLAACVAILFATRSRNKSEPHSARLIQPAIQPAAALGITESSEVAPSSPETPSPPWEISFGEIADQPEWLQSQEELEELADRIPEEQLSAALDELSREPSSASVIVARRLVQRWAAESPEAAAEWVAYLPSNAFGQAMCRQAVISWSQKDLTTAAHWTQQLASGENKTAAISALALDAAARGKALRAISLAADLPGGTERDDLLNYAVQQWAVEDTDAAVNWIEDIQDSALRQRMLGNVAVNLGAENPPAAAQLVTNRMEAGPSRDEALNQVVRFWAASAPKQAAEWVQGLSDKALRDTGLEIVTDVWRTDRAGESDTQSGAAQQL